MKIFILALPEYESTIHLFKAPPPEMQLFEHFSMALHSMGYITENINEADAIFIPIDFTRLMFGYITPYDWDFVHHKLRSRNCFGSEVPASQPPTNGELAKRLFMKCFWNVFVKPHTFPNMPPGFILFPYVLYEISFEFLPKDISILAYEDVYSCFNRVYPISKLSVNRIIMIPYWLGEDLRFGLPKVEELVKCNKKENLSFVGTLADPLRPVLSTTRQFIFRLRTPVSLYSPSSLETSISQVLNQTRYLLVLRGDTPTRRAFYQCFAYSVVPVIFEEEVRLYQRLFDHEISDSCLVLPNITGYASEYYARLADEVFRREFIGNKSWLRRVKRHAQIFEQMSYSNLSNSGPVARALRHLIQG